MSKEPRKVYRITKWMCKKDDKQEFDSEYEAFRHVLSHGELIQSRWQYDDYFVMEKQELPEFGEESIFRNLKVLASEYDSWKLPIDASFLAEHYLDVYEAKILSRFLSYAIGFAVSHSEEFKRFSQERMADLIVGIKRKDIST